MRDFFSGAPNATASEQGVKRKANAIVVENTATEDSDACYSEVKNEIHGILNTRGLGKVFLKVIAERLFVCGNVTDSSKILTQLF